MAMSGGEGERIHRDSFFVGECAGDLKRLVPAFFQKDLCAVQTEIILH